MSIEGSWTTPRACRGIGGLWQPVLAGPHDVLLSIPQFSDHEQLEGIADPKLAWTDPLTPTPDPTP
jgi:hypothetical protein